MAGIYRQDWATFREELKLLANKDYPDLQEEAREQLPLKRTVSSSSQAGQPTGGIQREAEQAKDGG